MGGDGAMLDSALDGALDGGVSSSGRNAKRGRTRCGLGRTGRRCDRCARPPARPVGDVGLVLVLDAVDEEVVDRE